MTNLESALKYLNTYHLSIIPTVSMAGENHKKPLVKWEEFKRRFPTEKEITEWWSKWPDANITLICGLLSNVVVIDADIYKMTTNQKETFEQTIPENLIVPIVDTPRGGKHYYFTYINNPCNCSANGMPTHVDLKGEGGLATLPPSSNGEGKLYTWLCSIKDITRQPLPESYKSIIGHPRQSSTMIPSDYNNVPEITEGSRDNTLFHIANCLIKGGAHIRDATRVLEILAKNCNPPFPEKEVEEKIKSALKRTEKKERNFTQEVKDWVCLQDGYFMLTEAEKSLQLLTREEKKHLYVIVNRLKKEGLIEKHGQKSGTYRLLETAIEEIDILSQDEEEIDIQWPFGIESLVKTNAKNIVVVAGVPDSGKTAFLLNVIEKNMHKYDIHYFVSEMGKGEIKTRLSKFKRPIDSWKFHCYERSSNFADVIRPNDINIIDFLEIYQEHYLIGQWIKDIYDKLDQGIAIIAIQKKPGASAGVGGNTTKEKARLYVTMDNHRLEIGKGKNWANEMVNPNHMFVNFKIVKGCKFLQLDDWQVAEIVE